MEIDALASEIYDLPSHEPADSQDEGGHNEFIDLVEEVSHLEGADAHSLSLAADDRDITLFSEREHALLKRATKSMRGTSSTEKNDPWVIEFFPKYGAVLLGALSYVDVVELQLLSLEQWKLQPKCTGNAREKHTAISHGYFVYACGEISETDIASFVERLRLRLSDGNNDRRANQGGRGPSYSPAFLYSCGEGAVEGSKTRLSSRGGTLNVGSREDGTRRNTVWPLVKAGYQYLTSEDIVTKIQSRIDLCILDQLLKSMEKCSDRVTKQRINTVFGIMDAATLRSFQWSERGRQLAGVTDQISCCHDRLVKIQRREAERISKKYTLPMLETLDERYLGLRLKEPRSRDNQKAPEDSVSKARSEIGGLPVSVTPTSIAPNVSRILKTVEWMKSPVFDFNTDVQTEAEVISIRLFINTVEDTVFQESARLESGDCIDDGEADALVYLFDTYISTVSKWVALKASEHLLYAAARSHEILVSWICTALLFQRLCREYPLVEKYSIALKPWDLEYLVTPYKRAIDGLKCLLSFLHKYRKDTDRTIFSCRPNEQKGTQSFAREYAKTCTDMMNRWKRERKEAERREKMHWNIILQKKAEARKLQSEIRDWRAELSSREQVYDSIPYWDDKRQYQRKRAIELVAEAKSELGSLEQRLIDVERAPDGIIQPIPQSEYLALPVIFYFEMPKPFQEYSRICFQAQFALVARKPYPFKEFLNLDNISGAIRSDNPVAWGPHYSSYSKANARDHYLRFYPSGLEVPRPSNIGPRNIQNIHSVGQCVWYPDCETRLTGPGTSNPFLITGPSIKRFLSTPLENVPQWLMQSSDSHSEDSSTRGNLGLSDLRAQPGIEFLKQELLELSHVRAQTCSQPRRIVNAVGKSSLPWHHTDVKTVLRQAAYEIGVWDTAQWDLPISWHEMNNPGCQETLQADMATVLDRMKETPREHRSFPILAELAVHFSQWFPVIQSRSLRTTFMGVCESWVANISARLEEAQTTEAKVSLHVEGALISSYAIICCDFGTADVLDLELLCRFIFRVNYGRIFSSEMPNGDLHKLLCQQYTRQCDILSRVVPSILNRIHGQTTISCALNPIISGLPDDMIWKKIYSKRTSFEAFQGTDHYVVDLLSGRLLINGAPPGRLPQAVKKNPKFLRFFGNVDFEVRCQDRGTRFTTVRAIPGREGKWDCFYDFEVLSESEVSIWERPEDSSEGGPRLRLCDIEDSDKMSLPVRFKALYSHWVAEDLGLVALRPVHYTGFQISHVCRVGKAPRCFRVPLQHQVLHLSELEPLLDTFVASIAPPSCWTRVLSKFESEAFVHGWRSPDNLVSISLPRYGLSFYLDDKLRLRSEQLKDYHLAEHQQLTDWLPFFSSYLLLEKTDKDNPEGPDKKILVPDGKVSKTEDGKARIQIPEDCGAIIKYFTFGVNLNLRLVNASSRSARLRLAAIHAAAGTYLPDTFLRETGHEYAMYLVRRSVTTCPLEAGEATQLGNLAEVASDHFQLTLLAGHMWTKSNRLEALHGKEPSLNVCTAQHLRDAGNALCHEHFYKPSNDLRTGLRNDEYGFKYRNPSIDINSVTSDWALSRLPDFVGDQFVVEIEDNLGKLLNFSRDRETKRPFPLQCDAFTSDSVSGDDYLIREILRDLQNSWTCHQESLSADKEDNPETFIPYFEYFLGIATQRQEKLHEMLLQNLTGSPRKHSNIFDLLLKCNRFPQPVPRDLLATMIEGCSYLKNFNPFLSNEDAETLKEGVRYLLELWVLQDKLRRLLYHARYNRSPAKVCQDLVSRRVWDTKSYPYWLAFEVENEIQIRPEQYDIAAHLIGNPGGICQLNMGLGKTRVVLPMLVLHFVTGRSVTCRVPRLHFPTALLGEGLQYLSNTLTAGIFGIPIYIQPFHRDISIDESLIRRMQGEFASCLEAGGIQVVAVEHRLSLLLKWHESRARGGVELKRFLDTLYDGCIDIFDESDSLLGHKYQLIYAVGAPTELPQVQIRITTLQSLLRVISRALATARPVDGSYLKLRELLEDRQLVSKDSRKKPWMFPPMRLVELKRDDKQRRSLRKLLVECLLEDPPKEVNWLTAYSERLTKRKFSENLIRGTTQADDKLESCIRKEEFENDTHWHACLALQAFLGHGILELCLERRHRVQYGLDGRPHRKKRLAVPYSAADVPSERSEYSHPDVSLVYSLLSHYYDGLSMRDVAGGVGSLLQLGRQAQRFHHERWMSVYANDMREELSTIDDVRKLDPTNVIQRRTLHKYLGHNPEFINFWFNTFVIGNDTYQYPGRLIASACHLPGSHPLGFSGTNDNSRLLPPTVRQADVERVRGTNGKMVDVILSHGSLSILETRGPGTEDPGSQTVNQSHKWKHALDFAIAGQFDGIIDTGSLLAGEKLPHVAQYISQRHDCNWKGVIYFESSGGPHGRWMVLNRSTGLSEPRAESPIRDDECFIIFDEARTRGADMKMKPNAKATITLGPRLSKDRLMQGAGRLRQLGNGQTIVILCPDDVSLEIRSTLGIPSSAAIDVKNVLEWVLYNTQKECVEGLSEYASHVFYHATTSENPDSVVIQDSWELEDMYHVEQRPVPLPDHIKSQASYHQDRVEYLSLEALQIVQRTIEKGELLGSNVEVIVSKCGEECEREVEQEEEAEKEQEYIVPRQTAIAEPYWPYRAVLFAESASDMANKTGASALGDSLTTRVKHPGISKVSWSEPGQKNRVFMTAHFAHTVQIADNGCHGQYLRPIDGLLIFPDHTILVLSDREADGILRTLWESLKSDEKPKVTFINLHRLHEQALFHTGESRDRLINAHGKMGVGNAKNSCFDWDITALRLANGETSYKTDSGRKHLRVMLRSRNAREAVEALNTMHGNRHNWACSELESACIRVGE